jgi:hypothetical protein
MKIFVSLLITALFAQPSTAQVTLNADGPGNTYALITSVLAPGANPIETPDCSHNAFGNHIDEVFDTSLNANVFQFYIHTTPDNDRCTSFDRQRNEIKTYASSPNNLKGIQGEIVRYKWKFKLPAGFQSSSNFTHIHQLKSVGGTLEDMPMYTLTTRKGNPDQLQLRYAATDTQVTLLQTSLSPFIDTWVDVTETVTYNTAGTYAITIRNSATGAILLNYSNNNINNWRPGGSFVRPKWGIYRSLINAQDLRDETLRFAAFSIEELASLSINDSLDNPNRLIIFPNPARDELQLSNIPIDATSLFIYTMDGRLVLQEKLDGFSSLTLNTTNLINGTYLMHVSGLINNVKELLIIHR